jgi:hypothetical protein
VNEEWRAVPGYENLYEVSNLARVRSLPRRGLDAIGRRTIKPGHVLKIQVKKDGYHVAFLYKSGKRREFGVHVLVALAFVGPKPDRQEVCHWDDDKSNNLPGNLRWGTRSENVLDKVRNGGHHLANRTHCKKSGHPLSGENLYITPSGRRQCRECSRARRRECWLRNNRPSRKAAAA